MAHIDDGMNERGEVWCPKCETYKLIFEFTFHGTRRARHCRACRSAMPRPTREQWLVRNANSTAKLHGVPGRLRVKGWRTILKRYGGKCLCCGTTDKVGIDHVVPFARGGDNVIENIQPMCQSCNRQKHAQTVDYRSVKP